MNKDPAADRHPDTVARLLVPGLALSGCVPAHLWRDTTRAAQLSDAQRSSCFPATPFCGLTWTLQGEGWQIDADGYARPLPGACLVTGPRSRPTEYRSAAGLRCFMSAITPDALHALTGLDIASIVDLTVPMDAAHGFGADWQQLNQAMLRARDAQHCQALFEDFLLPRWRQHCEQTGLSRSRYRDWMQHLALHTLAQGHGRSLRQLERRIKQWSGQSLRALRSLSRAEAAFVQVRREMSSGELIWAAVAQDSGYADQAHLCRETRRVTGFSPEALRRRIDTEERFWAYRVWV